MKTSIEQIKKLFKSNFSNLFNGKLIELNEASFEVMASFEDNEGGYFDPELILDAFNNKVNEEEISTMFTAIKNDELELEFKNENDDYIITAGNNEAVYVIKLQIFRIK